MKFSAITAAFCLATSAFASPVAVDEKVARADLVPQAPSLPEVPGVEHGLLAAIAPCVIKLISGLCVGRLTPELDTTLVNLSEGLKTPETEIEVDDAEVPEIQDLTPEQAKLVYTALKSIVQILKLDKLKPGEKPQVNGLIGSVLNKVLGAVACLLEKLGLKKLAPNFEAPVPLEIHAAPGAGLLAQLCVPLTTLLTVLRLGILCPGLVPFLTSLIGRL